MARMTIALLLLAHPAAGAWRRVADLPFGLSDFTATVVPNFGEVEGRGRIVIVGGCDEDQVVVADPDDIWPFCPSVSNKVLLYDYAADKWSRGNNAPRARYRHAAATDGHKLYVLGGRNVDDGLVPQTDVYDTHTGKWATIAAEVPRSDLGAIWNDAGDVGLLGPHILVAGGYDEKYTVAYTETLKINPETGETTPGANLLTGRGDFGFVSTGDNARAYAVGGYDPADWCTPLASVETLDLNSNWPDFAPSKPLLVGRADKAVAYGEDAISAVGGERNPQCSGSAPQDDVEKLGVYPAVLKATSDRVD